MRRTTACAAAVLAVAIGVQEGRGQIVEFSEETWPTNPQNDFSAFTFDDFAAAGAFTDGPTSIILDVTDADGSNGVFGGVGVDYGTPPDTNQVNFDASAAHWEMRIKILPENEAEAIRTTYIDHDGGFPVAAEEYVYEFDLTAVPVDGEFHLLSQSVGSPLFNQDAFNFDSNDDGVNNPGLRQMQIQSVFDSTGRLNVEIDFVRIVPEPAVLAMVGIVVPALALVGRRRRLT